jgi:hypothetical protein
MRIVLLLALLTPLAAFAGSADWSVHARRFTGESASVRAQAIRKLRNFPGLEAELKKALGTRERFLALDVITTLKVSSLLPHLLKSSLTDDSGSTYHAINALITPGELPRIRKLYYQRLRQAEASPASKVVLLDTLGRMGVLLQENEARALLEDPWPEVRQAALLYLRQMVVKLRRPEYLALIRDALEAETFQLRAQAVFLIGELPGRERAQLRSALLRRCGSDSHAVVREACMRVTGGRP